MKIIKDLVSTILKTLSPRHYSELGERGIPRSIAYFISVLFVVFILAGVIAIPKIIYLKSELDKGMLDLQKFTISGEFKTAKPILIPHEGPLLSFDTTGNRTLQTELLLITDKTMFYSILGKTGKIEFKSEDYSQNRKDMAKLLISAALFIAPSLFFFYYLAYMVKYVLIIIPLAIISFLVSKLFKNRIRLDQAISLAFYTSTIMIFIEILLIPFSIKKYLLTYSFLGVGINIIALTLYLALYVTAVRIAGNYSLKTR
jgi:hypothetical protein